MSNNIYLSFVNKYVLNIFVLAIVCIWSFFESVLFVGGFIACIMLPVIWPIKFACAVLWLVVFYIFSKVIGVLERYRARHKNSE